MKKMTNERHMQLENIASDLDILRELDKRGALDEDFKKKLAWLESKDKGLQIVMETLEKYAKSHWNYMTEVSLDASNILKCNLLVMTSTNVYTLEINHFDGDFEYKNGESYVNEEKLIENPIQNAKDITSQIMGNIRFCSMLIHLKVKGAVILTGTDDVVIHDIVEDIEIFVESELEAFAYQMVLDEKENGGVTTIIPNNLSWLARVDRRHPVKSIKIPRRIKNNIRRGVTCYYCDNFDVQVGEIFTGCPCGGWENTEETIVRTICEYGVLNIHKNLGVDELNHFFDYQVPFEQLETYLLKHFTPIY